MNVDESVIWWADSVLFKEFHMHCYWPAVAWHSGVNPSFIQFLITAYLDIRIHESFRIILTYYQYLDIQIKKYVKPYVW